MIAAAVASFSCNADSAIESIDVAGGVADAIANVFAVAAAVAISVSPSTMCLVKCWVVRIECFVSQSARRNQKGRCCTNCKLGVCALDDIVCLRPEAALQCGGAF